MLTAWRTINTFSTYSVSNGGNVRNDHTNRLLALTTNREGSVYVGLRKENAQYKKTVSILVADAFIDIAPNEAFNGLIHLDGDRSNNCSYNLMWRPRWFVMEYQLQFQEALHKFYNPIQELDTLEKFKNPWEAAIRYGLIHRKIVLSLLYSEPVWPTRQRFMRIANHR